jgi:type I restriction enzyme S subunit
MVKPGNKLTVAGAIPDGWDCTNVRGIASSARNAIAGGPFGSDLVSADYVNYGVPVIRGQNMSDQWVSGSFAFVTQEKAKSLKVNLARPGDIVFTQRGTLGQVSLVPNEPFPAYLISQSQMKLSVSRKIADPLFYYYVFTSKEQQDLIRGGTIQTGVPHINLGILRDIPVQLPPLPEQRAIAAALGDVDALLGGLERLIAKKRDLKQAAMQQLLTGKTRLPGFDGEWAVKRVGEIGSTYGGLTGKTKADFGNGSSQYITFMNVMSNVVIDCSDFERVRIAPTESQNRVMRGDLLFNGSSETPEEVAMCALQTADVPNLFLNSFCFGFRIRDVMQTDGLYLAYYIRSREGRELMKSLAQGSTRYNLSKGALLDASLRLPSLREQAAIAAIISDMDAELSALIMRRDKTRILKQGMMQELLTGKTRLVPIGDTSCSNSPVPNAARRTA